MPYPFIHKMDFYLNNIVVLCMLTQSLLKFNYFDRCLHRAMGVPASERSILPAQTHLKGAHTGVALHTNTGPRRHQENASRLQVGVEGGAGNCISSSDGSGNTSSSTVNPSDWH